MTLPLALRKDTLSIHVLLVYVFFAQKEAPLQLLMPDVSCRFVWESDILYRMIIRTQAQS
jgi:hypothetical protein